MKRIVLTVWLGCLIGCNIYFYKGQPLLHSPIIIGLVIGTVFFVGMFLVAVGMVFVDNLKIDRDIERQMKETEIKRFEDAKQWSRGE